MDYGFYEFDIKLAGFSTVDGGSAKTFDISLSEDIHSLLPKGSLSLRDLGGLGYEKLVATQGLPVEITMGRPEKETVVLDGILGDFITSGYTGNGIMNGTLNGDILHKSLAEQTPSSMAYDDTTSNVIKTVLSENFTDFDIEASGGQGIYYQQGLTPLQFVLKHLSKKLFNSINKASPYYVWVDIDSKVHVKTRKSLMEQPIVETIYAQAMHTQKGLGNIALDMSLASVDFVNSLTNFNVTQHSFNMETGEFTILERSCLENNPNPLNSYFSMISPTSGTIHNRIKQPITPGEEEMLTGSLINSQQASTSVQSIVLVVNLSTHIRAGSMVKLVTNSATSLGDNSTTFTGNYLVEKVLHTHNGLKQDPITYTHLTISRADALLPDTEGYPLKSKLRKYSL